MALLDIITGGTPAPPPAPDYRAAAEETAAGNLRGARISTIANRPNEYTPYGSREWTRTPQVDQAYYDQALADWQASGADPSTEPRQQDFMVDNWQSNVNLSPEGQQLFDAENRAKLGMANLGEQGMAQLGGIFQDKFNIDANTPEYNNPGTFGENRQRVMDSMLSRVNTQVERDREDKRAELIASGIPPGSEAWKREMDQIDYQLNDARQQAEIAATDQANTEYRAGLAGAGQQFSTGMQTRGQQIQEAMLNRQTPLNEFNAFRTGAQVNMPKFGSYGMQGKTAGADYSGATGAASDYALAGYNADVASKNAITSALFGLGSGYLAGKK